MKKRIIHFIVFVFTASLIYARDNREIIVDFSNERGLLNKSFRNCVGAGRANEGLRADWQEQLRIAKKELGFKYIRFHGLLHDDMGVYREDKKGNAIYNWQYIDKLYDFIIEIGMKPFVELSFMPSALKSGEKTVFWWKGNITPPKSYEKYRKLIKELVIHLKNRYGDEEVKTWYFEVWNEPDHKSFFTGSIDDYFKMYKTCVTAIKSVSKEYKVGGPASAGVGWISKLLEYCVKSNVPIDFISAHAYGVKGVLNGTGPRTLIMINNPNAVVEIVKNAYNQIRASKCNTLELHITEWSTSYAPKDPIHDTYQNATYILNTLKQTVDIATSMSYWVFTDIFEEPGPPIGPFHGGFGLMNLQGLKKPTYYAYLYLNRLGDIELVNSDKASWICKNNENIQALIWDFTYLDQQDIPNQKFYKKKLPSNHKCKVNFQVSNMHNGHYTLKLFKTGFQENDPYTMYYDMGSPEHLSKTQTDSLAKESDDKPIRTETVKIKDGIFHLELDMRANDIYFIELIKT